MNDAIKTLSDRKIELNRKLDSAKENESMAQEEVRNYIEAQQTLRQRIKEVEEAISKLSQ